MSDWSENTFRVFEDYYPDYAKQVIDQKDIGDMETVFVLDDGNKILFNEIGATIRFIRPLPPEQIRLTDEQWLKEFSRRVKKKMRLQRLTQADLSKQLDVSMPTVNRYVNGKSKPDYLLLQDLANVLKCNINEITDFWYLY